MESEIWGWVFWGGGWWAGEVVSEGGVRSFLVGLVAYVVWLSSWIYYGLDVSEENNVLFAQQHLIALTRKQRKAALRDRQSSPVLHEYH